MQQVNSDTQAASNWEQLAQDLASNFAANAAQHDDNDTFVSDNFNQLKQNKLFSACVPTELGGG